MPHIVALPPKKPVTIFSDGCASIALGIARIIPQANHFLDDWHHNKTITDKFKSDDNVTRKLLFRLRDASDLTTVNSCLDQLELLAADGTIHGRNLISTKEKWAHYYRQDCLTLGQSGDNRSESFHSALKKLLNSRSTLQDVVEQLDHLDQRIMATTESESSNSAKPATKGRIANRANRNSEIGRASCRERVFRAV